MPLMDSSDLLSVVTGGKYEAPDDDIIHRFRTESSLEVPIEMTDLDVWANYLNDDLYEMDKKIREFLRKTSYKRENKNGYRTTASVVFAWIYGREPGPPDGYLFRLIHELLKYYCTSYTGTTTYKGKPVTRVYRFSKFAARDKRAYSLRLRMEEAKDVNKATFRKSPNQDRDKRTYGRQPNRKDGE